MANDQFKTASEKHTFHVKMAYVVEKITISQSGPWGEARTPRGSHSHPQKILVSDPQIKDGGPPASLCDYRLRTRLGPHAPESAGARLVGSGEAAFESSPENIRLPGSASPATGHHAQMSLLPARHRCI